MSGVCLQINMIQNLKKIMSDFQSNYGIDCNFIKTNRKKKEKVTYS